MKEFKQNINKDRNISLTFLGRSIIIQESIMNNDVYEDYRLIYSDDYGFSGYSENTEKDELTFNFDIDHPLYYPFFHFLGDDKEVKISSDFKKEEYDDICYFKISRDEELISLSFVNYIHKYHYDCEKFNYEIKNVMYDLRSKLDYQRTDIKDRLCTLFREATRILTEEYHQVTMEEYMNKKKVFKK